LAEKIAKSVVLQGFIQERCSELKPFGKSMLADSQVK
jgi:hypothetical protein